jgi:hypothetical protein
MFRFWPARPLDGRQIHASFELRLSPVRSPLVPVCSLSGDSQSSALNIHVSFGHRLSHVRSPLVPRSYEG